MATKKLRTPKLTVKEVKLIKALVAGKSQGEAGMLATGSTNLASGAANANRMLKSVNVQDALAESFIKHGINIDTATAPIGKALKSKTKFYSNSGELLYEVDNIDHQLKGSDRAFKLMGIGQEKVGGNTFNFNFADNTPKEEYIDVQD